MISEAFQEVSGGAELPVFGVNGSLGHYITTKKDSDAKTIKGLPPTEYKLEGEEAIKNVKVFWSESSKPKEKQTKEPKSPKAEKPKPDKKPDKKPKPEPKSKGGYVPPPPPGGAEIPPPPSNAKVKSFKVSSGPCPPPLEIPNVQ